MLHTSHGGTLPRNSSHLLFFMNVCQVCSVLTYHRYFISYPGQTSTNHAPQHLSQDVGPQNEELHPSTQVGAQRHSRIKVTPTEKKKKKKKKNTYPSGLGKIKCVKDCDSNISSKKQNKNKNRLRYLICPNTTIITPSASP